jgi:hypothetical protein
MKNQKEKPFLKKGDLFVISNVQSYRDDYMGDTLERYNESLGVHNPMFINGELWEYDEKYCKEGEVIRLSHKCDKDYGYDELYDFVYWLLETEYGIGCDDGVLIQRISSKPKFPMYVRNVRYEKVVRVRDRFGKTDLNEIKLHRLEGIDWGSEERGRYVELRGCLSENTPLNKLMISVMNGIRDFDEERLRMKTVKNVGKKKMEVK